MNAVNEPARACPSRLRFDRLLADELAPVQASELTAHAAGCARCGALLAELRRGRDAFAADAVLPDAVVQRVRDLAGDGGRGVARLRWAGPLLAAAAALLTWTAWPEQAQPWAERSKGSGVQLAFYVLHDGVVRPGSDGERVQPGDQLQLAYTSEREAYLAILSIDAAGKATAYYEKDGRAAKIIPARSAVLDRSTLLDATLGPELVYTLVCAEPITIAPLLLALERAPDQAPAAPGCTIERHTLLKVPR